MFRSRAMRRVELVVPEHDVIAVTEALAASRAFHIAEQEGEILASEPTQASQPGRWMERAATYARLEQRISDVMRLLGVEAGAPPDETLHLISPDVAERDIASLEQETTGPVQELDEELRRLERLRELRSQLTPLVGLDIDLRLFREARYIFSMLGTMPADNVERLQTSLEHIPSALIVLMERRDTATVVLFGLRRDAEILGRAARSAYLNPFELPDTPAGSPEEVVSALDARIERTRRHVEELQAAVQRLHETRIRRLHHLLWRIRASRAMAETIARFRRFRYAYLIAGWVAAPRVAELRRRVTDASGETTIDVRSPTVQELKEAPFDFDNPPLIRMFEPLVTTYGYPRYTELDPTPLLALTFPLIFGIMFGDVGHGLFLVLLGALLVSRRVRAFRSLAGFGKIVIACGIMATLFGFLYGGLFGIESILPPLWLRPLEQTTDILLVSIGFGVVVMTLAMVYNTIGLATRVSSTPRQRWGDMLFDRNGLAGIVFYWSLIGMAARFMGAAVPVGASLLLPLALVSGVAIALGDLLKPLLAGEPVSEVGSVGMTVVEGSFELFETLLSLLSNTLSYVRMGAFAVAHGALMLVVFILAAMVDSAQGVAYWIVVVLGNLVVIGFEGMIVGIQTLRLEYYELFSKFFTAGGEAYQPLSLVGEPTRR